jgi:hypothetical protein
MREIAKRRIEAAREAARLVKQLPQWMLTGLELTKDWETPAREEERKRDERGEE